MLVSPVTGLVFLVGMEGEIDRYWLLRRNDWV